MSKTYAEKLKDPRWQKCRLRALERDGFMCRQCGDTETTLHVHHLGYHGDPWEAPDKELETICKNCHKVIHIVMKYLEMKNISNYQIAYSHGNGIPFIYVGPNDTGDEVFFIIDNKVQHVPNEITSELSISGYLLGIKHEKRKENV